ncbi:MAG: cytochrome C oxidase subunit I [Pseudomonadota bacterium]
MGRWKLLAILLVCASPLLASYLSYYVIKPEGRTNYGEILDPRLYPLPMLKGAALDGSPTELTAYKGKWIMLQVGGSDCNEACKTRLYEMRQLRLAQGKAMSRIERVWLIPDSQPLDTALMREYDGTRMLRVQPALLEKWLPVAAGAAVTDHLYLIDPLGNLMMRFPKQADPNKVKKDLGKLLRASSIG